MYYVYDCSYGLDWIGSEIDWIGLGWIKKIGPMSNSAIAHREDFMILSCVVLTQYSTVTDGQTEGRLCRSKDALSIACCRA